MALKDFIRNVTPSFLLAWYRKKKKHEVNKVLNKQKKLGEAITTDQLVADLRNCGICLGDTLLVHSSLSKIGYVEGGAPTVVHALMAALGERGNLLMPSSPNAGMQLDYIKSNPVFDVLNSPSAMGSITEYFRKQPRIRRSLSPTEPICAFGPDASYFTSGHTAEETPYTANSPFYRITEKNGKILYIGVTLINAGTSLHLLEDAVQNFPFPVYCPQLFTAKVIDEEGQNHSWKIKVHNPEMSNRRKCDELIPLFESTGCLTHCKIGKTDALLLDAKGMLDTMLRLYHERGITMYTPQGNKI
ncbi:MAG: AAC(3) family N-acetyltransferase [Flavobacteriales bacterium]